MLRFTERILVEGQDRWTIYVEDATSEPILVIDDFVDVPDVGVEGGGSVNNVDRERSEIGTNDEREGVGVGEGDNIEREDVGVASKDDIEIGNEVKDDNVEREDVGVASEDDIKIDAATTLQLAKKRKEQPQAPQPSLPQGLPQKRTATEAPMSMAPSQERLRAPKKWVSLPNVQGGSRLI
ncbi:hypothetical protein CJ030_MR6G016508 [Morella rubra]|uniref:Uncharacterized protein n=1 Tax=Morella rubra TaxID=262757 RepID=A0A6A1V948_9ROSI|nr:hypothetical protein CJ030_MR6G016508 [Morella rubra]